MLLFYTLSQFNFYLMCEFLWLAVVQGITEAFPVSSSAHLILLSRFFGWKDQGIAVDVALHFGTLFALFAVFYKDFFLGIQGVKDILLKKYSASCKLFLLLTLSTLPAIVVGFVLHMGCYHFRSPLPIACGTIIFAVILYAADRWRLAKKQLANISEISYIGGFFIGCFQAMAFFPGVSRLGICITAGRLAGYSLNTSAHFSFLLGMASIFSAIVLKLPDIVNSNVSLVNFFYVTAVSFFISVPLVSVFLVWTKKLPLWPLILYRIGLGVLLLVVLLCKH